MSNYKRLSTLCIVLILNMGIFLAELIIATKTESVALKADAFHVLSDMIATVITIYTIVMATKPITSHATYGWVRSEIIGGFANSVFLLALAFNILIEAIDKIININDIKETLEDGIDEVLIVGSVGLGVNLLVMIIVHYGHIEKESSSSDIKHVSPLTIKIIDQPEQKPLSTKIITKESSTYIKKQKINTRGLWLHIIGDLLGSIVVVISSLIIKYSSGDYRFNFDPSASLITVCVICYITIPLLSKCLRILMQTAPSTIDMEQLKTSILESSEYIKAVTALHVWQLDDETLIATVKYEIDNVDNQVLNNVKNILKTYGIEKCTVESNLVS